MGFLDSVAEISQSALIGSFPLSHARPYFLNDLVAATPLAFLVAAAASRVNLRSGRTRANQASAASHPTTAYICSSWLAAPASDSQLATVPPVFAVFFSHGFFLLARMHSLAAAGPESSLHLHQQLLPTGFHAILSVALMRVTGLIHMFAPRNCLNPLPSSGHGDSATCLTSRVWACIPKDYGTPRHARRPQSSAIRQIKAPTNAHTSP